MSEINTAKPDTVLYNQNIKHKNFIDTSYPEKGYFISKIPAFKPVETIEDWYATHGKDFNNRDYNWEVDFYYQLHNKNSPVKKHNQKVETGKNYNLFIQDEEGNWKQSKQNVAYDTAVNGGESWNTRVQKTEKIKRKLYLIKPTARNTPL